MPRGAKCVTVYLKSDTGFLQARIENGDWVTTTSPYGTITVCK